MIGSRMRVHTALTGYQPGSFDAGVSEPFTLGTLDGRSQVQCAH